MLKAVLLPVITLVFAVTRIFMGNPTFVTWIVLVTALLWIGIAYKEWKAKEEAAEPRAKDFPPPPAWAARSIQRLNQAPPPPLLTEKEILATSRPAIFLQRSALPVPLDHPGNSYLGGNPRLPPDMDWPDVVPFLAQIDLAELPGKTSPLPRKGTVFFFADINDDCPEPSDCRVLYYAGDASRLPFREPPDEVRAYSRTSAEFGSGSEPFAWLPAASPWARTPFRFPFEFTVFESVRDYLIEEGAVSPPRHNREVFNQLMDAEATRRLGARGPSPATEPWRVFREVGDDWPFAWVAIDYGARVIVNEIQGAVISREGMEAKAEYQAISDAASKWIERAAGHAPHERCDEEVRHSFAKAWQSMAADFTSLSKRINVHRKLDIEDLRDVLIAACYTCASHGAATVIPEQYRSALVLMNDAHDNFRRYQMLGHGECIQWAPVEHAQDALLLQLFDDGTLGWEGGSGCVYQFWISPDAARKADFDSVQMTLECD